MAIIDLDFYFAHLLDNLPESSAAFIYAGLNAADVLARSRLSVQSKSGQKANMGRLQRG